MYIRFQNSFIYTDFKKWAPASLAWHSYRTNLSVRLKCRVDLIVSKNIFEIFILAQKWHWEILQNNVDKLTNSKNVESFGGELETWKGSEMGAIEMKNGEESTEKIMLLNILWFWNIKIKKSWNKKRPIHMDSSWHLELLVSKAKSDSLPPLGQTWFSPHLCLWHHHPPSCPSPKPTNFMPHIQSSSANLVNLAPKVYPRCPHLSLPSLLPLCQSATISFLDNRSGLLESIPHTAARASF